MHHLDLCQVLTTGKPARFSCNGKRISRDTWDAIHTHAIRIECFSTKAKPMDNGGTKRWNYSTAIMKSWWESI